MKPKTEGNRKIPAKDNDMVKKNSKINETKSWFFETKKPDNL